MNEAVIFIVTLAGLGELPFAPGMAAVLGAGWGWWLRSHTKYWYYILILQVILAIIITNIAAAMIGKDPFCVVIDEFVAAGFLVLSSLRVIHVAASLTLFILFDYLKILGIHAVERLPGGFGIVLDDIAAASIAIALILLVSKVSKLLEGSKGKV
ncbi:phosphatidylglycerophosphatase A family protein [Methanolobus halotolerans]|uniref:YutG/PgpA domain-containing protein n=1 Tax=Methanolobus halotolerans TaxID=2052935 RepID=A0A4E0PV02_9EURY|nr:phosphatidylglycerophosphatase A [Methanolobus halotolerans]TGC09093.1 hypothetical protein CUN85_06885 [Methanolobus halotolerans]